MFCTWRQKFNKSLSFYCNAPNYFYGFLNVSYSHFSKIFIALMEATEIQHYISKSIWTEW